MRIATWNVNSIRAREERVLAWLERHDVDVLAMQETKCRDEQFPLAGFQAAGYEVATYGLDQWNGVAIASRVGLRDVERNFPGQPGFSKDPAAPEVLLPGAGGPPLEARALGATVGEGGSATRVWSLYIPNGREVDDPHYRYKLAWLAALREAAAGWLAAEPQARLALLGDWNVVPRDEDVWDIAAFAGATHVTPAEREAFFAFADCGLREVTREHLPAPHTYTYWDYQGLSFPKDYGMRIDFAYASPTLAGLTTAVAIDREERKGKGASDHVPVVLEVA